uniref:Cytochrome c oxidase subunit 2 n=1 Tax=Donax semistriatus TaxID=3074273 RepID=A0A286NT31_9BIVA|nr:cytochrome c oxidase subunit II [Donax semistriatus]ATA66378.1 cytochrome c oxidase subunit II [Donax semistriatus]
MPNFNGQMGLCDWGSSSGLNLVFLHDYLVCVCFMIMCVVGGVLVLIVPKASYLSGGIHFRNVYRENTLELWWTIIPIFMIIVMGYPSFVQLYAMGMNDKAKFITVKVTGHQWYWSYEYQINFQSLMKTGILDKELSESSFGGLDALSGSKGLSMPELLISYDSYTMSASEGELEPGFRYGQHVDYPMVLPGNSNVEIKVTSADVIHCWTVHGLGVKMDAVPGRVNSAHLSNLRPGFTAWGGCSEMCGLNHWQMSAEVEVLRPEDFITWALVWFYSDLTDSE